MTRPTPADDATIATVTRAGPASLFQSRSIGGDARQPPWAVVAAWSLLAALGLALFVGLELWRLQAPVLSLLQPGARGPAASLMREDFPTARLQDGAGNDGQQFYAIARDPMHLREAAKSLDRPRYRLQRPLLPWMAWVLHPSNGGRGLVLALAAANVIAVIIGALALGLLADRHGRSVAWAVVFACLPGTYMSLRISTADALAVGLALLAVAAYDRGWTRAAMVAGVLAVLAKESSVLILLGVAIPFALRQRRLLPLLLFAGPAAVSAGWWLVLYAVFGASAQYSEFALPFRGLVEASSYWVGARDIWPALTMALTIASAIAVLLSRQAGPWALAIVLQLGVLAVLGPTPLSAWTHAPRTTLPLLAVTIAALVSRPGGPSDVAVAAALP